MLRAPRVRHDEAKHRGLQAEAQAKVFSGKGRKSCCARTGIRRALQEPRFLLLVLIGKPNLVSDHESYRALVVEAQEGSSSAEPKET